MTSSSNASPNNPTTPDVIYLPDQRQTTKTVTSGSNRRKRMNVERFRTDDKEHDALLEKVRASGMSFGAYMRHIALGMNEQRPRPRRTSADAKALTSAIVAFKLAGNNLNQIARAAHALAATPDRRGAQDLTAALRELYRQVEDLRCDFAKPIAAMLEALDHVR